MLEGKTIFEALPDATAAVIEPLYRAALSGTTTTWDVPYEGHTYSQPLAPVTDASGRIVASIGFTQDVTEARAAQSSSWTERGDKAIQRSRRYWGPSKINF